jgi:hypothetical protein
MTDFSAVLAEPSNLDTGIISTLGAIREDEEIIASVTLTLYPGWVAEEEEGGDPKLEDGRATWHGIVDELTGSRAV